MHRIFPRPGWARTLSVATVSLLLAVALSSASWWPTSSGRRRAWVISLLTSAQLFQTADVFVGVLILAALGVGLTFALRSLQKKLTPWQLDVREQQ